MDYINKRKFGKIGEKIARDYLQKKGYKILEMNYYTQNGEIDIIAKENETIIFVEVKTRTSDKYGTPGEAINQIKKMHIEKSAAQYLFHKKLFKTTIRFDAIEILIKEGKCQINHIKQII